ncbi:MAG: hypothetical protein GF398_15915 [Chitinivibrionales bacterium]|nr:hypothetical protein [Chitinivibrionales bacterium]
MRRLFILVTCTLCIEAAIAEKKHPFSESALKWLLQRGEYERFDYFIANYLEQHPDTAVLHLLNGYRYFEEAMQNRRRVITRIDYRTGGIPRKYPDHIPRISRWGTTVSGFEFDEMLLQKAFQSLYRASHLEPEREDISLGICRMSAETGRADIFTREVAAYIARYGTTTGIKELAASFLHEEREVPLDTRVESVIASIAGDSTSERELDVELSRRFVNLGQYDSALIYATKAVAVDTRDTANVRHACIIAVLHGRYDLAATFALQRYELVQSYHDLLAAAVCASVNDSARADSLLHHSSQQDDSLDWFRDELRNAARSSRPGRQAWFRNHRLFLNLPLAQLRLNRSNDKAAYYSTKAGVFYVYAHYDSSVYYNLNLLRQLRHGDANGPRALFNLAAEYYAAGLYDHSHVRFIDLYKYFGGWNDAGVRYALGLNNMQIGNIGRAKAHFAFVIRHPRSGYAYDYDLGGLARYQMSRLNKHRTGFDRMGD